MNGDGVTYTVKELIGMLEKTLTDQMDGIVRRLDKIDTKLDEKATNTRVLAVEERLGALEGRISNLELTSAGANAVSSFQRWIVGTVGVGVFGAIATLVWLASGGH